MIEQKKPRTGLQMVLHDIQAPRRSGQLHHYSPTERWPWRPLMEGNSPNEHSVEQHIWLFTLSGLKHDQKYWSTMIRGHLLTFGLDGGELRKDKIRTLIQEGERGYVDGPLRMGTVWRYLCSMQICTNTHCLKRRLSIIRWTKWQCLIVHQLLFLTTLLCGVAMLFDTGALHRLSTIIFSPRQTL